MIFNNIISRRCLHEEIMKSKEMVVNWIFSLKAYFRDLLTNAINIIEELILPALAVLFMILLLRLIAKKNK